MLLILNEQARHKVNTIHSMHFDQILRNQKSMDIQISPIFLHFVTIQNYKEIVSTESLILVETLKF